MTPQQNTTWIYQVRQMLKSGYGTEDIAINLKCKLQDVKNEVDILRQSGELKKIYGAEK